ncbi:ATP-binding protein [Azotosporobacter soli]|uniref:ATP-binding protein n=1 Tax=Azotosporobacter soli TaxID=3055040 RepID=UPI0031FE4867
MSTLWHRLQRLSLYYKVNGLIIGMLLLCSLIIGFIMLQSTSRLLDSQMEKRGTEIASYIAALSSNDILIEDHFSIFDRLNKTKANNEEVRYILVTDSAGRILAHTFTGPLPQGLPAVLLPPPPPLDTTLPSELPSSHQISRFSSNEGPIREISVPIEGGDIGFVRVGMSEKTTQILLAQKFNEIILTTLLICFLAGIGATHITFVLIQPVHNLSLIARQIQEGNYDVQADVRSEDEVGRLAKSFNAMAASLREKDLENNRLLEELRAKEALRASLMSKLFTVQEDERRRLSRELHDETGQSMASLLAYMKVLLAKLTSAEQKELLMGARDVAISVLDGLRKMAVELRPPVLDYLGIVAALEKYAQNFAQQHSIEVNFAPPAEKLLVSNDIALALYRILQESLTNIAKHANAHRVDIELTKSFEHVKMVIRDDGQGIHANALATALEHNRLGLFGMQERAELLGGSLVFRSSHKQGATIIVILPMGSDGHV